MQRKLGTLAVMLLLCGLAPAAPRAAAQIVAGVTGTILGLDGKPVQEVQVIFKSDETGTVYNLKTDKNGVYKQIGVRPGVYEITLKPKDKDVVVATMKVQVQDTPDNQFDIDLKKMLAEAPALDAARKKQDEDVKKFNDMKSSFTAGQAKTEEADKARVEMMKAPSAQRAGMQDNVTALYQTAQQEFQQAQKAAPEKDKNLHLVYYRLGYTAEMLKDYDGAIASYQKAIELQPNSADYYNSLALAYAKAGKFTEATQTCEKAASLDPAKGAAAWYNLGVVLYYANNVAQAVDPLKKATALAPNTPDAWYLLGAALLATMQTKQEGDKITYIVTPGTAEAYQRYLELAPSGSHAPDAQAALQGLQSLGVGVETKIKVKKKS